MDNGYVEVPTVHEPIVRIGFAKKKRSLAESDKESWSRVAAAGTPSASPFSLSMGFHMIRGLVWHLLSIPSLKSLSLRRSPPMLVERMYDISLAGIASATALCDVGQVQRQWCLRLEDHCEECWSTPWEVVDRQLLGVDRWTKRARERHGI